MRLKLIATAVAAAIAASSVSMPAAAQQQQQQQRVGIFPLLAGPIGLAAAVGTTSTTTTWFTSQWFSKHIFVGFKKVWTPHGFKKIPKFKKVYFKKKIPHSQSSKSSSAQGKAIVGCIFGSALGAITSSMRKATAMGNPPRWRSQAEHERIVASGYEKQFELTNDEAATALALCGLGSFALHWPQRP